MDVASSTSNAAKAFAVYVEVKGVQVVELATFCGCCQPTATFSGESHFLPFFVGLGRSQPFLFLAVAGFICFSY